MKKTTLALGLVAAVLALLLGAPSADATVVETFDSAATITVDLPGTKTERGIEFEGSAVLSSIDFSTGKTSVEGIEIDLDGEESSYTSLGYDGLAFVPAHSGPATVTVSGKGNLINLETAESCPAEFTVADVQLASRFSENSIDANVKNSLELGIEFLGRAPSGDLAAKDLENHDVTVSGSVTVVNLDGLNGVIDISTLGSVKLKENLRTAEPTGPAGLDSPGAPFPQNPFRPSQASGLGLMVLGFGGLARSLLRRRRA